MMRIFTLIALIAFLSACSSPKSASEPNAAENTHQQDSTSRKLSPERERVVNKEKWMGSEIVTEAVERLDSKLSLNKSTKGNVEGVLKDTFASIGGELTKSYSMQEARDMGKKIIMNGSNRIIEILDEKQQAEFKQLLVN